ncbi:MFS transporter [Henriciella aquimarina]|uniref:MFS transporter n=1 Tax=Henriciella aquimarina TaxID=545261 RepID=UPI0009FDD2C4|nr:MFS transporter [Henriciella aquimarina]
MPEQDKRRTATLIMVCGATMLALIVFTVPLTTLAPTAEALSAGPGAQAWFLSAMPLGAATGLLGAGALGDNHGRRSVFLWGLCVMMAASVAGAMAPTPLVLILARVAQGLGSAAVMACGLGLLKAEFPDSRALASASAFWAASLGSGVALGPILAAFLTTFGGWPAAYWGTGLISAILLLVSFAVLPHTATDSRRQVDWLGTITLMVGLAMIMSGLTEMRLGLARSSVLILIGAGGLAIGAFLWIESRLRAPLIDLSLFRNPGFIGATMAAFASGAGILALMTLVPTLLERAMGVDPRVAAFVLCAWSATSVITALGARWLPEGLPPRYLLLGGLLGCVLAQFTLLGPSQESSVLRLLPGLFLAGAANGILNAALGRQAVETVPHERAAMGSGANNTARYLGSAIGITLGAVLIAHGAESGGMSGLLTGWNEAVLATTAFSLLGAVIVAVAKPLPERSSAA